MIDEGRLTNAVDRLVGYKAELGLGQRMAASGFAVKSTRMTDFLPMLNGCSRQAIAALEMTDPGRIESLGELLINAAKCMVEDAERREKGMGGLPGW